MLLSSGRVVTRTEAELKAREYYETLPPDIDAEELANPSRIREWVKTGSLPEEV